MNTKQQTHATPCYAASLDDADPVTGDWLSSLGALKNDEVVVKLVAITHFFDGIEIWQDDDSNSDDRILAVSHYPITRGDLRKLCWALNVPGAGQ